MGADLYPLLFEPVYRDYLWGGQRLATRLGRRLPGPVIAESWEITERPEGMSRVANGPRAGESLRDLRLAEGPRLVGRAAPPGPFPLLFKILDAGERLSLQVHPDEESARRIGGEPKTEFWLVLDGSDPSAILSGLKRGVDRAAFEKAMAEGSLRDVVNVEPVRPGDAVFLPGGRLHAVDAGCLLYEIQQNSDTTYRISDWGRVGPDGAPRDLHIDEALAVINWNDTESGLLPFREVKEGDTPSWQEVFAGPHFHVARLEFTGRFESQSDGQSFHALFAAAGGFVVEGNGVAVEVAAGTSCLLPAALGAYSLTASGPAKVIRATL